MATLAHVHWSFSSFLFLWFLLLSIYMHDTDAFGENKHIVDPDKQLYAMISWFHLPPSIRFAFLASLSEGIDPWISSRFSKTSELGSRLAAQLAHIALTITLLEKFIVENKISDCHSFVSYERYCDLKAFIHNRCPPSVGVVTITDKS